MGVREDYVLSHGVCSVDICSVSDWRGVDMECLYLGGFMKVQRDNAGQGLILDSIKYTHPFQFNSLPGLDPGRVFIKTYTMDSQEYEFKHSNHYALVIDLESGGIRAVAKGELVTMLDYDFTVHGPVPRYPKR